MTLVAEISSLSRAHWRAFLARLRHLFLHSRLLTGTICLFLVGYLFAGYYVFSSGLRYFASIPGVGRLLAERILYMSYFMFFLMLIFSNAALLYSALFRAKETAWLLTTPVSPRAIFCWKVLESFFASSWGLAILSAPLLAAIGNVYGAPPGFYWKSMAVFIPFLTMPAMVGGILTVFLVRYWGRVASWICCGLFALVVVKLGAAWVSTRPLISETPQTFSDLQTALKSVLGHAEIATSPFLPSAWMTEMISYWSRGHEARGGFYGLLLLSWMLLLGWLCVRVFSAMTHPAWNLSQSRKASHTRQLGARALTEAGKFSSGWTRFLPFLSRQSRALIRKDVREFCRDSAQWVPCLVVFTLLMVYATNLNRTEAAAEQPTFRMILTGLSFGVSCLTLSTLTTRFVFPMFSLEGRRLWILGLSPAPLEKVYAVKLGLYTVVTGLATFLLMFVSSGKLHMGPLERAYYCCAIVLMSGGLSGLALGLGVLFPNFHGVSPAKIVSSFGGTLCLILNFIYITLFMGLFMNPVFYLNSRKDAPDVPLRLGLVFAALTVLTLVAAGIPSWLAIKRLRSKSFVGRI